MHPAHQLVLSHHPHQVDLENRGHQRVPEGQDLLVLPSYPTRPFYLEHLALRSGPCYLNRKRRRGNFMIRKSHARGDVRSQLRCVSNTLTISNVGRRTFSCKKDVWINEYLFRLTVQVNLVFPRCLERLRHPVKMKPSTITVSHQVRGQRSELTTTHNDCVGSF